MLRLATQLFRWNADPIKDSGSSQRRCRAALQRRLGWIFGLALSASLGARQARVATCDGRSYEGHVRTTTNGLVIANADEGYVAQVELSNLMELTFKEPPTASPPAGESGTDASGWTETDLPRPWQSEHIGSGQLTGSASFASGLFRVRSAGTNILEDGDAFHFVYKAVRGNSEIMARIVQVQSTGPEAKAGVMMRGDLTADAPCVLLAATAGRRGSFQWREKKGATTRVNPRGDLYVPHWLKLTRNGDIFTAYRSRNGTRWWWVDQIVLSLPEDILVGLAATSGNVGRLGRATFDRVREAPSLPGTSFVPYVELQSGSRVVGPIASADTISVCLARSPNRLSIPLRRVSRMLFQWVPWSWSHKVDTDRPGVLLTSGEFIEGEFRGIERTRVKLSSVLFGMRSYDVNHDLIAVVLRKARSVRPSFEVRTVDGSTWLGDSLEIGWNELVLGEASLGRCHFPIYELAAVRRKGS